MSPEKILIVDDNDATRYAVRRVLERHGFGVIEAATGNDGLAILAAQPVLALVLDVNLPDISGFDVVRRLRGMEATRLLPVLHVSAASIQNQDLVTGLEAGADAYLVHPVDHDVLLATLRALLRVRDAEQAMAASEARMRDIFAHTAAPIAVLDTALVVQESNAAFARLFADAGEGARQPFRSRLRPGQDALLEALATAIARDVHWNGVLATATGREVDIRITPYREPGLGLMFIEDVTAQRARERSQQARLDSEIAQREHADSQLAQLQKMDALGQLTGGIAHDFNNMLTSIMAGVDLISSSLEQGRPERVPRFVEIITSSAQRAAGLTQRMLAFARQQPLDPQACDVNERIRSLEDMLARTIGEHIVLELDLADRAMVATVDVNQLENVIINLVINSRDAMPGGGHICVSTRAQRIAGQADLADGDYIMVAVADTGSGIAPELIEKVFDPFFTTKPIGKGTGLGLSMTYGFARQSGGTVRLSSTPGKGTRIELLFPAGGQAAASRTDGAPAAPATPVRQARLLLVDDNELVRQTVADILSGAGYEVVEAGDAQAALAALEQGPAFDLLLTDVGLPGISGARLADIARAAHPRLPIVFMTGYASEVLTRDGPLGEGMSLLAKPFSMRDVLDKVRATVG